MTISWVPFTLSWDEYIPIDVSFLFEREKPAGKHGFLTTRGDRFMFEDGIEGRFWGTNFNGGANFPPHAYSEMVARRLAKFGVNLVRTHQMDAEWSTPNLFSSNRARPQVDTRTLDADALDRLDYLIFCLKHEGIYIYLDLLSCRQFLPGDEVDSVEQLTQAAKPYAYFDERLIELQKEFNFRLWNHFNPYTKLFYKDEPAIALTRLMNEIDPFAYPVAIEPFRTRLEQRLRIWAEERDQKLDPAPVDFSHPTPFVARFLVESMKTYYKRMLAHLHEVGVRVPVNGASASIYLAGTEAQTAVDFSDSHAYWNLPSWEHPTDNEARPMIASPEASFPGLCFARLQDRPFFVSEWSHAWPDPYRAESPLWYAAISSLQGWGGAAIHTYRSSTWPAEDRIGGGAQTTNNQSYHNHYDAGNDPALFGLFFQAALLFRRGDVKRAISQLTVQIPSGDEWLLKNLNEIPALQLAPEQVQVGLSFRNVEGRTAPPSDRIVSPAEMVVDSSDGCVESDTGEVGRSWQNRTGWINTPRTQAAYGFLRDAGKIVLSSLELEMETEFATVALSSLSDQPIQDSLSLLLTAVGSCDNTDAQYSQDGRRQLSYGCSPVLIEPVKGSICIHTQQPNLKVWAISDKGEAVARLPATYEDGCFRFKIGPQPSYNPSTMYYLIRS